ncbi:MAG: hypothetical protein LBR29_02090 [Methylobacteriaceae bacterium]|jgi:hypothetical protein|nr:hypothetical protein [Methylobacteriaceae bacterium]
METIERNSLRSQRQARAATLIKPKEGLGFWAVPMAILVLLAYIVAMYVGFRLPNLWSANYYLPSFQEGFYRRGLVGALMYYLGDMRFDYYVTMYISFALFGLVAILVFFKVLKNGHIAWIFTLFLLSPYGGYAFHTIGYIDYLLMLLLFLAVAINNRIVGIILLTVSLFIHEQTVFTTIPAYFAYRLYRGDRLFSLVPYAFIMLAIIGAFSIYCQEIPGETIGAFMDKVRQKINYPFRDDFYWHFPETFSVKTARLDRYYNLVDAHNIAYLIPLAAVVGYLFSSRGDTPAEQVFMAAVGIFACAAPLLMGALAWDCSRWEFLSACFAMMMIYYARDIVSWRESLVCTLAMLSIIPLTELFYFDDYRPRQVIYREIPKPETPWEYKYAINKQEIEDFFTRELFVEASKKPCAQRIDQKTDCLGR